jgi:signal transduction histidine kinase
MSNEPQLAMGIGQALETLSKLYAAAPPAVASRLAQVTALLKHLADENTYLNSRLLEEMPGSPPASPTPAKPEQPLFTPAPSRTVTGMLRDTSEKSDLPADVFAGLSDALRPPLIAIRGRAELVQAGLLGQITPEQDAWLQAIHENTDRAFAVLDAVTEMVALNRQGIKIERVNFISTDLLTEAWERVRDRARQYNHEVVVQAPDIVPLAYGDFYQTLIVMTDLLDNALRYTPPGGQIRVSVDNLGSHVLFSVVDSGIGLTPEDMKYVGKPFWRGSHRLVRQHPGTGLRLYLARQLLVLQDGEMIFSGSPELGSTFSFTLPVPK